MQLLILFFWWLGILNSTGETSWIAFRTEGDCLSIRKNYARVIKEERMTPCIKDLNERKGM